MPRNHPLHDRLAFARVYADELLRPWYERLAADLPRGSFDAHTHTGFNDPDGFRCSAEELSAALELAGARAVVFTMQEPDGYAAANDRVLAEAAASDGRLVPFCRVDPHDDAVAEALRCLERGARGVKLHPRAERFPLDHPGVRRLFALADERRLPVLVHAGRGIPALGRHALELTADFPGARLILAHAGVSDLAWIWRYAPDHPNLFFDSAWWTTADLLSLLALVPPGQVLWASDAPYGTPLQSTILLGRCALQSGLSAPQLASVRGGQLERLLAGQDPLDVGPPPGNDRIPGDVLLDRVHTLLVTAIGAMLLGATGEEYLALTRLACEVGREAPQAEVCRSVLALLERHQRYLQQQVAGHELFPGLARGRDRSSRRADPRRGAAHRRRAGGRGRALAVGPGGRSPGGTRPCPPALPW